MPTDGSAINFSSKIQRATPLYVAGIAAFPTSALPPEADICSALAHVRFGPIADIRIDLSKPSAKAKAGVFRSFILIWNAVSNAMLLIIVRFFGSVDVDS